MHNLCSSRKVGKIRSPDVAADDHTVVRRLTATPLPTVNTP